MTAQPTLDAASATQMDTKPQPFRKMLILGMAAAVIGCFDRASLRDVRTDSQKEVP